jgi:hypothetical protein
MENSPSCQKDVFTSINNSFVFQQHNIMSKTSNDTKANSNKDFQVAEIISARFHTSTALSKARKQKATDDPETFDENEISLFKRVTQEIVYATPSWPPLPGTKSHAHLTPATSGLPASYKL